MKDSGRPGRQSSSRSQSGDEPRDVLPKEAPLQVEDVLSGRLHEPDGKRAEAQREGEAGEPPGDERAGRVVRTAGAAELGVAGWRRDFTVRAWLPPS